MVTPIRPRVALIRDHYQDVIREVMAEQRVPPSRWGPSFEVPPDAGLPEVLQYADWYVAGRGDREHHHRYKRCLGRLKGFRASGARKVNVDVGCGTGLFSWAFLDWATENGYKFDQLGLYGLDRCQAMLSVAEMAKGKLSRFIADYPSLHYHLNVDELLAQLTEDHREDSHYFITFGYVLRNYLKRRMN